MRAEEVVSGGKDLDPKIPPLGAKRWGTGESNPIPPFAKTAKSGAPAKSKTQLRNGIVHGGSAVSCDTEDAKKEGWSTRQLPTLENYGRMWRK
jgi:hypothetical protein